MNICYDFSISSVYFLISSQIRLKSFHLKRHGYALKWTEGSWLDNVCVVFFFVTNQITLFLLIEKCLYWKQWRKQEKNKVVCDWQLVSLGASCCDFGFVAQICQAWEDWASRPWKLASFHSDHIITFAPSCSHCRAFASFPLTNAEAPQQSITSFFPH